MAGIDTGAVGAQLKAKAGPLPVWAWAGLGVVALTWYLKKRQAAAAATAAASTPTVTTGTGGLGAYPVLIGNGSYGVGPSQGPGLGGSSWGNVTPATVGTSTQVATHPTTSPVPGATVHPGTKLAGPIEPKVSPKATVYTVRPGDNLSAIAARYHTTWQNLYAKNRGVIGGNPNLIRPGQRLTI